MKNRLTHFLLLFITAGSLIAWKPLADNRLRKADWLLGTWQASTKSGITYERWTQVSSSELSGVSFMLNGKDTFVFETIQLLEQNNNMYYIPVVKEQNNNKPVKFTLKTISDTELVFENLRHDYPQSILYRKTGDNSMTAEISGKVAGKLKKQTFNMTRVN